MANKKYSNSVQGSLNGRNSDDTAAKNPENINETTATSKAENKTQDGNGTSKAGRPSIDPKNKRKQLTLTLDPKTIEKLEKCDDFRRTLNRYIDKNIDSIVKELKKL